MAKRTQKLQIFPASGGLQSANSPALVQQQNLFDMNNLFFTNDATRKTRPGLVRYDVSVTQKDNFRYITDFWRYDSVSGGQTHKVVKVTNGKVEADNFGDGVFSDVTGSFSINPNDSVTADTFIGLLIMAFENVVPKKYDHSGNIADLGGSPPNGSLVRVHRSSAWLAGVKALPHRLYRSYPGNPEIWSGAGTEYIDIDEGDGDPVGITAIFPSYYGDLYVAKRRSLYRIRYDYSLAAYTVGLVLRGVGCISHNSVVALQNDVIFCSERGVHSLAAVDKYGDVESSFLSAPIHDIYNDSLDFNRSDEIQGEYIPEFNSFVMTFPKRGATYNRDLLGYNLINNQWFIVKDLSAQCLCQYVDSRKKTRLMIGDSDGRVSFLNSDKSFDFTSTPINASFQTGILYPLGPMRTVSFKSITCVFKPQGNSNFIVTPTIDGREVDQLSFNQSGIAATPLGLEWILGVTPLGQKGYVKTLTKSISGQGSGIQLTFARNPDSSNIRQGIEVLGYAVEFMDSEESSDDRVQ